MPLWILPNGRACRELRNRDAKDQGVGNVPLTLVARKPATNARPRNSFWRCQSEPFARILCLLFTFMHFGFVSLANPARAAPRVFLQLPLKSCQCGSGCILTD